MNRNLYSPTSTKVATKILELIQLALCGPLPTKCLGDQCLGLFHHVHLCFLTKEIDIIYVWEGSNIVKIRIIQGNVWETHENNPNWWWGWIHIIKDCWVLFKSRKFEREHCNLLNFSKWVGKQHNRSIIEKTSLRSMILGACLLSFLLAKLAKTLVYLLNRLSTKANSGLIPKVFFFFCKTPNLHHLCAIWCLT